jgi:SAM-dependent methyltransferase
VNAHQHYDDRFFSQIQQASVRSATVILERLYSVYKPNSVLDVGCGWGAWLSVAEKLGSKRLTGIDGPWVNPDSLLTKTATFLHADFENPIVVSGKFDLCISVEVAEHLAPAHAERFVETLCSAADVVLFSAAVRHQGGQNHINEQWQSYWVDLFKKVSYQCFDIFRHAIWWNDSVEWWYRQNVFLYLKDGATSVEAATLLPLLGPVVDAVHPRNYQQKIETGALLLSEVNRLKMANKTLLEESAGLKRR